MRLTRRGERVALGVAAVAAFGAGLTAQVWNPIAHGADTAVVRITAPIDEDQVECAGTPFRVVSYGYAFDGAAVVECAAR